MNPSIVNSPKYKLFRFFASLKLAIIVLVGLAVALAVGTIIESKYDTPTAQFFVYRAVWFHFVLLMLGVNLFAVMVDRWPWKPRHTPFLLAHIGILILLAGSWLTDRFGLDGTMRVNEGETSAFVDLDQLLLVVSDPKGTETFPIKWQPPGMDFRSVSVQPQRIPVKLTVDQFMSHADPDFQFVPEEKPLAERDGVVRPAIKVRLSGGPMQMRQDFWLWTGQAAWSMVQAGPAWLSFGDAQLLEAGMPKTGPRLVLTPGKDGSVSYTAISSSNERRRGRFSPNQITGQLIDSGWKMVKLEIVEYVPDARLLTRYMPSRVQYGDQASPAAIHLTAGEGDSKADTWLGLGDRASLRLAGQEVEIGLFRRRVMLPFAIRLDRFSIERYEGSMRPMAYSSQVTVVDPRLPESAQLKTEISMNEPLRFNGFSVYQASYEDAMPRPTVSVFSVNQDPGRAWKYTGSILLVLGTILLFAMKLRQKKKASLA